MQKKLKKRLFYILGSGFTSQKQPQMLKCKYLFTLSTYVYIHVDFAQLLRISLFDCYYYSSGLSNLF